MTDPQFPGGAGGSVTDVISQLQIIGQQIGQGVQALAGRFVSGTFTLANATTTVVTQTAIKANSIVALTPTNATAALTQRTNGVYHSASVVGASFSVSTQSGSATGQETFEYLVFTPS